MNENLSPNYVVSPLLQKIFIVLGVAGYVSGLAVTLPLFFGVYGGAWRFSQYTYTVAESVAFPLLLVAIAYFSTNGQASKLWRLFQSILFAMIGLILQAAIVQLLQIPSEAFLSQLGIGFGMSIWHQVAVTLLVLLVYVVLVRRYMRDKLMANTIVPSLQRIVVVVAVSAIAIMIVLMLSRMLRQLPYNPNLSSFITTILNIVIIPAVWFTAAYLSNRSRIVLRAVRMFDAVLLSLMGVMILNILTDIATIYRSTGIYEQWLTYEMAIAAIALALYVVVLWFVRRQPKK